jgi:hypothetical protein
VARAFAILTAFPSLALIAGTPDGAYAAEREKVIARVVYTDGRSIVAYCHRC